MAAAAGQISFLTGKPLRQGDLLSAVRDILEASLPRIDVHVPEADPVLSPRLWTSALIVQRGLRADALCSALLLEQSGVRFCNPVRGTIAVRDRGLTNRRLADAGLPVPMTTSAETWPDVRAVAGGAAIVVKAADEFAGRGRAVMKTTAVHTSAEPSFDGPYIVQEHVDGDGRDYKVYVVGRETRGLIKTWEHAADERSAAVPFSVDLTLGDLARSAGAALDLQIYGVDFVCGRGGPVIVDVNPFPGFRGVADAPSLVASYLLSRL